LTFIWEEKQSALRALVRTILIDETVVDDVLQEAFSRVLKTRRDFHTVEEAFYYLRKTVLHTTIDAYRRSKRDRVRFRDYDPREDTSPSSLLPQAVDPLKLLIDQEETEQQKVLVNEVKKALKRLSPEQREAIEIFFGNGRQSTLKDLCRKKGVPYSTLRSRMLRGIDKIRGHLRQKGIPRFQGRS
jgi:RNA polymerase sigma factor (sigma-70 family)